MKTGFEFIDHSPFPMIEFKLDGVTLSPKQMAEIAEKMRVELLNYGVKLELKTNG